MTRDIIGTIGIASAVAGVGMLSVPWAFIVGGLILAGLSVWGEIRSDKQRLPEDRR